MSKSKELRERAWLSLRDQYWHAFAATLIVLAITSVGSFLLGLSSFCMGFSAELLINNAAYESNMIYSVIVLLPIAAVASVFGFLATFLISWPTSVGWCKFFITNTYAKPSLSEIFGGFKPRYWRNVGILFLATVKIYLWSLLFIIPGIVKSFEYVMIPFILADDPEISSKDAFRKAAQIMKGNKWRLFKLNISFFPWVLLCIPTFGLGVFFLMPYIFAANTEFYLEIKDN